MAVRFDAAVLVIVVGLPALVLAAYSEVLGFGFIGFDDPQYVYENARVMAGLTWGGAAWAFSTLEFANWHPLTWLSLMLDVSLFGSHPGVHHAVNVALHALDAVLLWSALARLTGSRWRSATVAILFAVHPQHVESVAWISERKDVLSMTFFLLTVHAYASYVTRGGRWRYLLVVVAHALGLASKPMLVTAPVLLLLLDAWPLRRTSRAGAPSRAALVVEKLPLLVLSLGSAVATIAAQSGGGAIRDLAESPLPRRLGLAAITAVTYVARAIWPANLAVFYPYPIDGPAAWRWAGALVLLATATVVAWRERSRRPYLAVGWGWYLCALVPVAGIVQVGNQASADRYTYLPMIGVYLAAVWGGAELVRSRPALRAAAAFVVVPAMVGALSLATRRQASYWRDGFTVFSRAIAVTEGNWMAWNNLGTAHQKAGDHERALECFQRAIAARARSATAWANAGAAQHELGRHEEAIASFHTALSIREEWNTWNNLGATLDATGRLAEAMEAYGRALRLNGDDPRIWYNLAATQYKLGDLGGAVESYRRVVALRPDDADAWGYMGQALRQLGRQADAAASADRATRLRQSESSRR